MELIDKDAIVAEIKKRLNKYSKLYSFNYGAVKDLEYLLNFINTLEVKEVDLDDYYHKFLEKEWFGKHCNRTMSEMMAFTAKHFFELGLRTQKGK